MKSPGIAALLAAVVGLFIMGVGHFYVGRIVRGVGLLISGWVLLGVFYGLFVYSFSVGLVGSLNGSSSSDISVLFLPLIIGLIWLVLWAWSIHDAYELAKWYNAHLAEHGTPPW